MTKKFKKFSSFLFALLILASSTVAVCADAYLMSDGFSYLATDKMAVIYDYDNRTSDVAIPQQLGDNYTTKIAKYAFFNNTNMTSLSFENASFLTEIGDSAFAGCSNIKTLVLPLSIKKLSFGCFQNCTSLTDLTVYSSIDTIPNQAFYNCSSLTNVTLNGGIQTIGSFAFANCTSLKTITLSKNVTSIAANSFKNDSDLTIRCYRNSYAHQYAVDNGISFELIDPYEDGDVNRDGKVNVLDATLVQKYVAGITSLDDEQLLLADFSGDGIITVSDATSIQKLSVGIL